LLLALASAVIPGFESRGDHDHILLPQIRNSTNQLFKNVKLNTSNSITDKQKVSKFLSKLYQMKGTPVYSGNFFPEH
jgi:hypothetical protein